MSSARSRLRTTSSRWSELTGARVKPQLPMTADVTPCQHEFEPVASQNTWASIMGVPVDEPRGDDVTLGIDLPVPALLDPADRGNAIALDTHVGAVGAEARPVNDGSVTDDEVVGHRSIFAHGQRQIFPPDQKGFEQSHNLHSLSDLVEGNISVRGGDARCYEACDSSDWKYPGTETVHAGGLPANTSPGGQ